MRKILGLVALAFVLAVATAAVLTVQPQSALACQSNGC